MAEDWFTACDSPPDAIVIASNQCGIVKAKDVRWIRFGHCSCGADLPEMRKWQFTYQDQSVVHYGLAQCNNCLTVYWRRLPD